MNLKNRKIIISALIAIGVLLIAAVIIFLCSSREEGVTEEKYDHSVLILEMPERSGINGGEELSVDVKLSMLGEAYYPAASMSIEFDPDNFEFTGLDQGNVRVTGDTAEGQLPEWSVNVQRSNETGSINIMYVDVSGGKYAFSDKLMSEEENILFTLDFQLHDDARAGDSEFKVKDAVFAASDSEESLSAASGTLEIKDGKIILED